MVSQEVAEVAAMLRLATRFFWYPLVMVRLHHVGSEWIRNLLKFPRMVPNSLKIGKGSAFNDFFLKFSRKSGSPIVKTTRDCPDVLYDSIGLVSLTRQAAQAAECPCRFRNISQQ